MGSSDPMNALFTYSMGQVIINVHMYIHLNMKQICTYTLTESVLVATD